MSNSRNKLKVLFLSINSLWKYGNIGMDQLLGYLREKGFSIDIQYFRNRQSAENILEEVKQDYDVYAFSVNSANYAKCVELSKVIKQKKEKKVIFGGGYPTRYYREVFKETEVVDYLILGDGEAPLECLLDYLVTSAVADEKLVFNHPAIVTKGNVENKKEYFNSVITWHPAYDYYLNDMEEKGVNSRKIHCIQIKNNICTGNCSFCTERHGNVIYKDINMVVSEIEYVHKTFEIKKIFFTDDNILDPNTELAKEHLRKLCFALKSKNMKLAYRCYIKALSVDDTEKDHELLNLMREVGFVEVFVGIEAGNQRDLDLYNKYTTVEQNYRVIKLLKQHDILPVIGYIAFNPYSSRESIKENFKLLCDIECTYLHNYLYSFVVINKYTKMYDMIKEDGLLLSGEEVYTNVQYKFENDDVKEVLDYVRYNMLPCLRNLEYNLDLVIESMLEHECWYENLKDYRQLLAEQKKKDLEWIKECLSLLFVDFDVNAFMKIEKEFWKHFKDEEVLLKEIYDYYVSLHY